MHKSYFSASEQVKFSTIEEMNFAKPKLLQCCKQPSKKAQSVTKDSSMSSGVASLDLTLGHTIYNRPFQLLECLFIRAFIYGCCPKVHTMTYYF